MANAFQVGGVFADSKATWRWAFLINPVSCAIFAPAYFSMLPSISLPVRAAWKQKILWMTDWLGIISLIFFMTSLVMVSKTHLSLSLKLTYFRQFTWAAQSMSGTRDQKSPSGSYRQSFSPFSVPLRYTIL